METALIEYGNFLVAGVTINATPQSDFPAVWRELEEHVEGLSEQQRVGVARAQRVGVMMPDAADTGFTYTAGFMVGSIAEVSALGLTGVIVPGSMYATVLVEGPVPEPIKPGFEYLQGTFIPQKGLKSTGVNLEVYGPGDVRAEDYRMYLWSAVTGMSAEDVLGG